MTDIAVARFDAAKNDLAIAGGLDRRPSRCGIVDATVCANRVQYRMTAIRIEVRADAREINRRANESLADAVSVGREVVAVLFSILESNGLNRADRCC